MTNKCKRRMKNIGSWLIWIFVIGFILLVLANCQTVVDRQKVAVDAQFYVPPPDPNAPVPVFSDGETDPGNLWNGKGGNYGKASKAFKSNRRTTQERVGETAIGIIPSIIGIFAW